MDKPVLQQNQKYEFENCIKTFPIKKLNHIQIENSTSKNNLLASLKLIKKNSIKNKHRGLTIQNKKVCQISKVKATDLKKNKSIRNSQYFSNSDHKNSLQFYQKIIKEKSDQNLRFKNQVFLESKVNQYSYQQKNQQQLKKIIQAIQERHIKELNILQSVIYELINQYTDKFKQNIKTPSDTTFRQVANLKLQNQFFKKRYFQILKSFNNLINNYQNLQKKFRQQRESFDTEIKLLKKKISSIKSQKKQKKFSVQIGEKQAQKNKISLGHLFTFKKYDKSQKQVKSRILQTDPEYQISHIKSTLQLDSPQIPYYQYYNQKKTTKTIRTQGNIQSPSYIKRKLKHKLSLAQDPQNQYFNKQKSIIEDPSLNSTLEVSTLQLQSTQSKI